MPRRDRTGPMGAGARSGRDLGMCADVNDGGQDFSAGYGMGGGRGGGQRARNGFGAGFRGGRGGGYGAGWRNNASAFGATDPESVDSLEKRTALLEAELKGLRQRMADREKEATE